MADRFPALFVSHGAPTLPIQASPAREFLAGLGTMVGEPAAILVVSAHWENAEATVSAAPRPDTIHDFFGFPEELYRLTYPAPGAPELAERVSVLLRAGGIPASVHSSRGLDHGAWVPLLLMYPGAGIPTTQLSVQPELGSPHHYLLGEALRPLRDEGVLILASGGATHNLFEFGRLRRDAPAPDWVTGFQDWLCDTIESDRTDDFLHYRERGPHAARNHPSEEHFLPIFAAAGAGTEGVAGRRIHRSHTFGVLAMDAYRFD